MSKTPAQEIEEKGYVIFRNVLTAKEIDAARDAANRYFATHGGREVVGGGLKQANAAVEVPEVRWLYHHPAILRCFRQALGQDEIMFTQHSDVQKDILNGWHKDDGTDPARPQDPGYFQRFTYDLDDCKVYKAGVYFQDHEKDKNGLWVREGSHRIAGNDDGPVHYTGTKKGDVIIFDVRITHSGQFKSKLQRALIRASEKLPAKALVERGLAESRRTLRKLLGRERVASFFTFGLPNQHTIEFARANMRRQIMLTPGTSPRLPEGLRKEFERVGVKTAEPYFDAFA
jgi:ribosomal protein L16/L10AE